MKKYILFDLDGTLTDPMEGICKSAARGLAHFGIEADYHDLTFFIGPPLLDTYRDRYGMNDEQAREAVAAFREYFQPTGIYEKVQGTYARFLCKKEGVTHLPYFFTSSLISG